MGGHRVAGERRLVHDHHVMPEPGQQHGGGRPGDSSAHDDDIVTAAVRGLHGWVAPVRSVTLQVRKVGLRGAGPRSGRVRTPNRGARLARGGCGSWPGRTATSPIRPGSRRRSGRQGSPGSPGRKEGSAALASRTPPSWTATIPRLSRPPSSTALAASLEIAVCLARVQR